MPRRSLEDRNIRKLNKTGNGSVIVTLPIEIIRKLEWQAKQKVVVKQEGKRIIIEDWER